jgi:hypothetical protein
MISRPWAGVVLLWVASASSTFAAGPPPSEESVQAALISPSSAIWKGGSLKEDVVDCGVVNSPEGMPETDPANELAKWLGESNGRLTAEELAGLIEVCRTRGRRARSCGECRRRCKVRLDQKPGPGKPFSAGWPSLTREVSS